MSRSGARAPSIGDLIQAQPNAGQAPSENTTIPLLRDKDNLYIGGRRILATSTPEQIAAAKTTATGIFLADLL